MYDVDHKCTTLPPAVLPRPRVEVLSVVGTLLEASRKLAAATEKFAFFRKTSPRLGAAGGRGVLGTYDSKSFLVDLGGRQEE